jgi:hypothetical protein
MLNHMTSESLSAAFLLRSLTAHETHPHLLVDCSRVDVECVLLGLLHWGTRPITHCKLPGPLTLPRRHRGTLLIEGLHFLTLTQQAALFDWMTKTGRNVQIISLTSRTIDSLIAKGEFLEGLFSRLSTVRFDIRSHEE